MIDMSPTIVAKSDQLNADDLAGGPQTITITRASQGEAEQPVLLFYEGSGKKSFRPCKSMRRVLAGVWGLDATTFVGKSLTVYRDASVKYGGEAVGGVRISHMSHITKPTQVSLITTRGKRALYTVQPLVMRVQNEAEEKEGADADAAEERAASWAASMAAKVHAAETREALEAITSGKQFVATIERLRENYPELHKKLTATITVKANELNQSDDPFATEAA